MIDIFTNAYADTAFSRWDYAAEVYELVHEFQTYWGAAALFKIHELCFICFHP